MRWRLLHSWREDNREDKKMLWKYDKSYRRTKPSLEPEEIRKTDYLVEELERGRRFKKNDTKNREQLGQRMFLVQKCAQKVRNFVELNEYRGRNHELYTSLMLCTTLNGKCNNICVSKRAPCIVHKRCRIWDRYYIPVQLNEWGKATEEPFRIRKLERWSFGARSGSSPSLSSPQHPCDATARARALIVFSAIHAV